MSQFKVVSFLPGNPSLMSLNISSSQHSHNSPIGSYSQSIQPLIIGLVAIFVIAAAIVILGDAQVERSVIRNAGAEHETELVRFSNVLHHSGLDLGNPQVREDLSGFTSTPAFATGVNRALFGLPAERVDIYSIDGTPLYSTAGIAGAPVLSGRALEAFDAARAGQFTSFFRAPSTSQRDFGTSGEFLQSFAVMSDVPPDSVNTGRPLLVAAITTDISSELSASYSTMWLIVSIFFFGSLAILVVVHWASLRSRARLQEANDELAEQYVAVRQSRERMIATADATKRAIAEELHGSVQTRLFSLWTRLNQFISNSGFGNVIDRNELNAISDELDDIRENDIRGLSHRLHPSIVRVGAAPALKSLCTRLSGKVDVQLHVDKAASELEPPGASPIPETVRLAMFRIAELAISNTIKHAKATRCQVFWKYSESEQALRLIVEDDGVGFDPNMLVKSEMGGLGIVNIQDYSDSINGTTVLKSEHGWGTTLTVTVPFVPAKANGMPAHSKATESQESRKSLPSNVTPFDQKKAA